MTKRFSIRRMTEGEVQIAIDWAGQEGWNPGLADSHCFFQADPNGFFLGLLDDEPIATGSAVIYDDHFAFCGLYIVKSAFRRKGYGIKLTEERLKYVGSRITGLDGVLDKVSKYQRIGYVPAHPNIRYVLSALPTFVNASQLVDLKKVPFEQLQNFDRKYFPADRSAFLRCWISRENGHSLGYLEAEQLAGYGVIRKCYKGYKIGPLFAQSPAIAQSLFEGLCSKISEGPVFLDIPEPNQYALLLTKQYAMTPLFEVLRMYRNGIPNIDLQGIYGITTFELG